MKKNIILIVTIATLLLSSFSITPAVSYTNEKLTEPALAYEELYVNSETGGYQSEEIIWDNGMNYDSLLAAQWDETHEPPFDAYLADDFQFEEDIEVIGVSWIGGYWNTNYSQGNFDWNITFYYDQGDGEAPGEVYAGPFTYTQDQCNPVMIEDTGSDIYYEFSVDLPEDIVFYEFETYWISIWAVGVFPPQSGWGCNETITMHQAVFKSEFFSISDWTNTEDVVGIAYDMCFQLMALCEPGIDVEKYVWDPFIEEWVDADDIGSAVSLPKDSIARFKIAIHNTGTCYGLTPIKVSDLMEDYHLEFLDADPQPFDYWHDPPYYYIFWDFSEPLEPCNWINITVNATVFIEEGGSHDEEPSSNYVEVIAFFEETVESDEDYAYVYADPNYNNPPYEPNHPGPTDGETSVDINRDLNWTGGDPDGDPVTYNVRFFKFEGTHIPNPLPLVSENQTETYYDPGELEYDTNYLWQIVAFDDKGVSTKGPVWSFTTETQQTPSVSLSADPTSETTCAVTVVSVTEPDIPWDDVELELYNISSGSQMTPPDKPDGTVSEGDIITINNLAGSCEYRLVLIYTPTGGTMGTVIWIQPDTPTVSLTADSINETTCNVTVASVSEPGIPWDDVETNLINITGATQMTPPDKPDGTVSEGDIITINNLAEDCEYRLSLIYIPTGGMMGTVVWIQSSSQNIPPVANFSYLVEGLKVTFDGSMSNDSDGNIVNYTWDFGDGSNFTYNVTNPQHIFGANGSYNVNLTVRDNDGATDSFNRTIDVANAYPKVGFKYETDGKKVTFTSTSYDIDGSIKNYTWDFGDGSNFTYNVTSTVHTYELENKQYDVTLTVTDNLDLSNSTTQTIKINDTTPPTVEIVKPIKKGIYLFNDFKLTRYLLPALIIGPITIKVNATDVGGSGIEKVNFYIDPLRSFGKPVGNDTTKDNDGYYTYNWTRNRPRIFFRYHIIKVEAIDNAGNSATTQPMIVKRIL